MPECVLNVIHTDTASLFLDFNHVPNEFLCGKVRKPANEISKNVPFHKNSPFSKCSDFLGSKESSLTQHLAAYSRGGLATDGWDAATLMELFQNPQQFVHISS